MTVYEEKINDLLSYYESLNKKFNIELESSPEGRLICQKNGKSVQFLQLKYDGKKRIRKGINKKTDLIKALARKEYSMKASEILSNNIDAIRESAEKQIPFDPDSILQSMSKAYARLPAEYFFDRDRLVIPAGLDEDLTAKVRRHEEWWRKPYKEYWGFPEFKERTTSRGQKVRSISELLIAEALYKYSIPFHYEEEFEADGKTYAPDFTFEGKDFENFYLDYFGMMNNPKYAKKNILKLDDYYDIGLIPGDNLIVVFNSSGVMNASVIEGIINNEIIPRL